MAERFNQKKKGKKKEKKERVPDRMNCQHTKNNLPVANQSSTCKLVVVHFVARKATALSESYPLNEFTRSNC